MYQALYRKYRPRTFSDVVGQPQVTDTLQRQVETGRTSHAYLFVGTRGTGKTTCAKILSRALNCEHPVNGDPCNECPSCKGIESGSILDVVEIDAASNNGVDNVRSLRDEAIYTPASVKKRVYIIDEVHMLSTSAFNALLKILEEPPEHLVFILATTELRKVPATILSRCQRFSFKRIGSEDIKKRLSYIARQEGFTLTDGAANLLSRLADGSMRDALSLLDQCVSSDTVDEDAVREAVGLIGPSQSTQLWRALARGDTAAALKQFQDIYQGGGDPSSVLGDLLSLCRDMLMICSAPESGASLIAGAIGPEQLLELRGDIPMGRLLMASKALQETISAMASVRDKRTGAELCLIELTGILSGSVASEQPYYNEPVKKAAPAAKSQSPRREPPRDVPPPPWEDTAPSPSSQMGAISEEAPPPWEDADIPSEDSVPWGKYGAGDMAEYEPEPEVPPEPAGVRPAAPSPQSSDSGWWEKVLSACRGSVEDTSFQFLSDHMNLSPDLNGSVLTLRAKNDFVLMMVNTPGVKSAVSQAASNILGRSVTVAAVTGLPDTGLREDKLDRLAKFGNIKFQ